MALSLRSHQSSLNTQHVSIAHNSADVDHADTDTTSRASIPRVGSSSPVRQSDGCVSPRYQAQEEEMNEEEELLHKHSVDQNQPQQLNDKKRQAPRKSRLKTKPNSKPERSHNQILGRSIITNAGNIDDDQKPPPQDCVVIENTSKPAPLPPPQSPALVSDNEGSYAGDCKSSCVSSLSVDDYQHIVDLPFMKESIPPDRTVHRNSHQRHQRHQRTRSDMNPIKKKTNQRK